MIDILDFHDTIFHEFVDKTREGDDPRYFAEKVFYVRADLYTLLRDYRAVIKAWEASGERLDLLPISRKKFDVWAEIKDDKSKLPWLAHYLGWRAIDMGVEKWHPVVASNILNELIGDSIPSRAKVITIISKALNISKPKVKRNLNPDNWKQYDFNVDLTIRTELGMYRPDLIARFNKGIENHQKRRLKD